MERLDVIEQILTCETCELHAQCNAPVPFRGDPVRIAVVGEAPGETEDEHGKPFIGPAGRLLGRLLHDAGITEAVGVCNTVSCYPHGTPTPEHVAACEPNKWTQLDYLDPTYILVLGAVALAGMRRNLQIRTARGRPFLIRDRICFAAYHPAAALRNGQRETDLAADLASFKALVDDVPDNWMDHIPDSCAGCLVDAEWWEPNGLGWCPLHLPAAEAPAYRAQQNRVAAQLDAARHRSTQQRDTAVAAVEANADDGWLADAFDALVHYLRTHEEFHVDNFWAQTQLRRPRESRALGPVVLRAARDGLMEKTGEFRKSVASNMTEKPCWRSLIYQGTS